MEQIAEEAHVAKATLYDNFDGRSGLTDALLDRHGGRVQRAMGAGLDEPLSARQVVRGGIAIFVRHIDDEPEIYRFITANASGKTVVEETAAPLSALISTVLPADGSNAATADLVTHALLGAVFTATERWAHHRDTSRAELVDLLVDFVWAGLVGIGVPDGDVPLDHTALARDITLDPEAAAVTDG